MGLWLKCPGCQANNPIYLEVCPHCGRSLDKLSPKERVYVVEAGGPAVVKPAAPHPAPTPAPAPAPAAPKKPRGTRKKKS